MLSPCIPYFPPFSVHSSSITWQHPRPPPPPPSHTHMHTHAHTHTHTPIRTHTHTDSCTHAHKTHTCLVATSGPFFSSPIIAALQAELTSATDLQRRLQEIAYLARPLERRVSSKAEGGPPSPSNDWVNELNLEPGRFFGLPRERALARDPPTVRRQHWSEPLPNRAPLRPERASGRLPVLAEGSNQSGGSQTQLPERVIEVEPQVKEKGFLSCMPCWPWSPCCRARSYIAAS